MGKSGNASRLFHQWVLCHIQNSGSGSMLMNINTTSLFCLACLTLASIANADDPVLNAKRKLHRLDKNGNGKK